MFISKIYFPIFNGWYFLYIFYATQNQLPLRKDKFSSDRAVLLKPAFYLWQWPLFEPAPLTKFTVIRLQNYYGPV